MARPKKEHIVRRTKNMMVRYTESEYELISHYAQEAGYPTAVYVRKRSLGDKVTIRYNIVANIEEIQPLTMEFTRIGNNLNQIAAYYNTGGILSREMHRELDRCITELRELRREVAKLCGDYTKTFCQRR